MSTGKTIWWCEHCHASGQFPSVESVYDAIDELTQAHNRHELSAVYRCGFDTARVRVALSADIAASPKESTR